MGDVCQLLYLLNQCPCVDFYWAVRVGDVFSNPMVSQSFVNTCSELVQMYDSVGISDFRLRVSDRMGLSPFQLDFACPECVTLEGSRMVQESVITHCGEHMVSDYPTPEESLAQTRAMESMSGINYKVSFATAVVRWEGGVGL